MAKLGLDRLKLRPKPQYIAFLDGEIDLAWDYPDYHKLINMWQLGANIKDIAKELDRDPDEVLVLLIDLGHKGKIEQRERGVYGRHELPGLIHCGR